VLWTPVYHTGALMTLRLASDPTGVLPVFSTPYGCEAWIAEMGWQGYSVSPPMWPVRLKRVIQAARRSGMMGFTLDPSGPRAEVAPLDNLLAQVEAKL